MKHLVDINVVSRPFDGFWMKTAYRIPLGKFPLVDRFVSQESEKNTPITEMVMNSLITNLKPGQRVPSGRPVEVKGIAWDGGYRIRVVEVSTDGRPLLGCDLNGGKHAQTHAYCGAPHRRLGTRR